MKIEQRPTEALRPYRNNPRQINDWAVNAVAHSIKRFGFRQPIVVDEYDTIIIGHTRWYAAQKLQLEEVPVHVAELNADSAAALRLLDNRSGEITNWDMAVLEEQVAELKQELGGDISIWFDDDYFISEELSGFQSASEILSQPEGDEQSASDVLSYEAKNLSLVRVGPLTFMVSTGFIEERVREWQTANRWLDEGTANMPTPTVGGAQLTDFAKPQLVDLDRLHFDPNNPRHTDPARLVLVEESLRKLGFVLPMYAMPDGMVLSGHQRLTAAKNIGATRVPVITLEKEGEEIVQINFLFNRATNDFTPFDANKDIGVTPGWPDVVPDSPAFTRCMNMKVVSTDTIRKWLGDYEPGDTIGTARQAFKVWRIAQPLIVAQGQIVNGKGRASLAVRDGLDGWPVVEIEPHEAAYAHDVLNNLSMDYSYDSILADRLRYSARRLSNSTESFKESRLRRAFTFALPSKDVGYFYDVRRIENARTWTKRFGSTVLDFGSGRGSSAAALEAIGVDVTMFEPFVVPEVGTAALPSREASVPGIEAFLERVRSTRWSSIFLNGVIQAIPFDEDRRHVAQILAALVVGGGTVYTYTRNARTVRRALVLKDEARSVIMTPLEEDAPPVTLSTYSLKTQAALEARDITRLFEPIFEDVKVKDAHSFVGLIARDPKLTDKNALRAALEFEFDLPYPDGKRMGLADLAIEVFSERLGVKL